MNGDKGQVIRRYCRVLMAEWFVLMCKLITVLNYIITLLKYIFSNWIKLLNSTLFIHIGF